MVRETTRKENEMRAGRNGRVEQAPNQRGGDEKHDW